MQLLQLELKNFKDFGNFDITFSDPNQKPVLNPLIFILGNNASGKTSIFEALLLIFGSFYVPTLLDDYPFEYKLCYILNNKKIRLERKKKSSISQDPYIYIYTIDDFQEELYSFEKFKEIIKFNEDTFIPKKIISTYSGINDRLLTIYNRIETVRRRNLTKSKRAHTKINPLINKRFVHSLSEDVLFYLPAIWASNTLERNIIMTQSNIQDVSRIVVKIKLTKNNLDRITKDYSIDYSDLSIDFLASMVAENFRDNFRDILQMKISISYRMIEITLKIKPSSAPYNGVDLFNFLTDLRASYKATVETYIIKNSKEMLATELSEGEYQLIKLLGMLFLTKDTNGLVLLDEPDVHLNPKLKYEFRHFLDSVLQSMKNSHVLINTHDPLLVNGAKAEEVRVLHKLKGKVYAQQPMFDAIGRNIDGLLRSEYFDLSTTLDYDTISKIKERENLSLQYQSMGDNTHPSIIERINKLDKEISSLPFSVYHPQDKLYEEYSLMLKELSLDTDFSMLDKEKLEDRKKQIKKVISKVLSE